MNLAATQWFLKSIVWSPNRDEKQKNISMTSIPVIVNEIFWRWSIDLLRENKTRPSVMEVSPKTFGLSQSILLIDHRIAGDRRIAGTDSLNLV